MQFYTFLKQNSETFDISHALFPLIVAKLSTLKKQSVFFAHPQHSVLVSKLICHTHFVTYSP